MHIISQVMCSPPKYCLFSKKAIVYFEKSMRSVAFCNSALGPKAPGNRLMLMSLYYNFINFT